MRTPFAAPLLGALVALSLALPARSQAAAGWAAYPAYTEANALAAGPDGLWVASDGGVFLYDAATGELVTATSAEGLRGGPVGALAVDEDRGVLWIGYEDGVVERLDTQSLEAQAFYDVQRADQYASRGVRRIVVAGDVLYLATDFGVVVFDAEAGRVRNAYARIGDLEAATAVNDVLEAPLPGGGAGLWAATDGGLYVADRAAGNLQAPGAWTRAEGLDGAAFSLALFDGRVAVGGGPEGAQDLYVRSATGAFERRLFINNPITDLEVAGDRLYALSPSFVYHLPASGAGGFFRIAGVQALSGLALGPDGAVWASDAAVGLFRLPAPGAGEVGVTPEVVAPPGPLSTSIVDVDVGPEGALWLVTERLEAAGFASISRLEDGAWTSYRTDDPSIDVARASLVSGEVGPDGAFFAGSAGGGVSVFRDGTPTTYDETNSSLTFPPGETGYVVVRDVAFEDDVAWVLNVSGLPLHRFDGQSWQGFPYPSGLPPLMEPFRLAIDELGQKWIALGPNGLAVWDTGADPASGADDRALRFTGSPDAGVGLPDPDVRDVVVDGQGRVWLGTGRGLAFVFRPLDAFSNADLATPQWPVTADGTSYLLRDVEVFDLEVDPAGQIWVGTSSGAYLVNAAGTDVVRTVTAETSPLPSDAVLSIAVDPSTGRVFFVTDEGLFSAPGDATRPTPGSDGLVAVPSPYRPAQHAEGVVVSGLGASVSEVRVLTVAGDVVYAGEVRGGSFRWNGRDRNGEPVPSGVYLVAAAGSDGSTRTGKVAVIR